MFNTDIEPELTPQLVNEYQDLAKNHSVDYCKYILGINLWEKQRIIIEAMNDDDRKWNGKVFENPQLTIEDYHENGKDARNTNRIENIVNVPHPGMAYYAFVGTRNQEGKGTDKGNDRKLQP